MYHFNPYDPQVVLAIGAHPDDIDFGAGGSVAKWAANGAQVHYLVLTDGSKGSEDRNMTHEQLVAVRQQEQRDAAAALGVHEAHFLNYEDGALEITQALKKDIVRLIRQVRPDTVVTMDPTFVYSADLGQFNHPDHRAAGQATLDAVFPLARDHLSFPELLRDEQLEPHKVAHVLLVNDAEHNYFIDMSTTFQTKIAALQKHASQFHDVSALTDTLTRQSAAMSSQTGYQYTEGFMRVDCPE